jgi:hypothetical protein
MNPHPNAYCENCGAVKPCVSHEACSQLCGEILGVSKKGLVKNKEKAYEYLRAAGYEKGQFRGEEK